MKEFDLGDIQLEANNVSFETTAYTKTESKENCSYQDETLKHLANSVDRVQSMALRVNEELVDQNRMLTDIDNEVDRTESKLASVHKSLKMLANDSDRGKYCVICLLIVLLVWLVMMVLE